MGKPDSRSLKPCSSFHKESSQNENHRNHSQSTWRNPVRGARLPVGARQVPAREPNAPLPPRIHSFRPWAPQWACVRPNMHTRGPSYAPTGLPLAPVPPGPSHTIGMAKCGGEKASLCKNKACKRGVSTLFSTPREGPTVGRRHENESVGYILNFEAVCHFTQSATWLSNIWSTQGGITNMGSKILNE